MRKALIFRGGWDGHQPIQVSERFARILRGHDFDVEICDSQDCLADVEALKQLDLIIPCWTMGSIDGKLTKNVSEAVGTGVGLAGCHGGMCDAFRQDVLWQFITGGQWVSHPGGDGVKYMVNIRAGSSPIIEGLDDFEVCSEQYYLHVDPAINVLATTRYPVVPYWHSSNGAVDVPVAWTKYWGNGRVFYSSLGHHDDVFDNSPNAQIMMERGLLWAADGKQYALQHHLTTERFENTAKMF